MDDILKVDIKYVRYTMSMERGSAAVACNASWRQIAVEVLPTQFSTNQIAPNGRQQRPDYQNFG